jgi:hypothetical protein
MHLQQILKSFPLIEGDAAAKGQPTRANRSGAWHRRRSPTLSECRF